MKITNSFLICILSFVIALSLLANNNKTTNANIIVPAKPKSVVCFYLETSNEVVVRIKNYSKKGYIVKSCTSTGYSGWIVIMEKY